MRHFFHTELLDAPPEEGAPAERWLISYADFITLLFALFVVMYSISSVNDGKFRVLSAALLEVFRSPEVNARLEQRRGSTPAAALAGTDDWGGLPLEVRPEELPTVLAALVARAADVGIEVRESADWTAVELPASFAFAGGDDQLAAAAGALVDDIATLARAVDMPVRVEAFSAADPAAGADYEAGFARSAVQAGTIAARLVAGGVGPERVAATGYGPRHPVASNDSADGRAANRRVVVAIARHDGVEPAAASVVPVDAREALPQNTLQRVTELPGAEEITL